MSTTIERTNFLVNTEVFRTQPPLGDQRSREMRNYSLCCSARFSAINIAYYRRRSPVLLHSHNEVPCNSQNLQTYRFRVQPSFTLRASTFASAKVTVECVSEVPASDFVPETGDPKIEGFRVFFSVPRRFVHYPFQFGIHNNTRLMGGLNAPVDDYTLITNLMH